jgi:tetratricopeptide (TPR) repeat protein
MTWLNQAILWIQQSLPLILLAICLAGAVLLYWRSRKEIVFEAWINMADSKDSDLGRSVADLLLFKLRFIKSIHEQSARNIDTWQPGQDMPAFRQGLDEDIKLLGSVELGKYGSVLGGVVAILFRLVPMILRPARLRGSIHKYGDQVRLLATLELGGRRRLNSRSCFLWEALGDDRASDYLPETIEGLAYRIYLDLTSEDLFKSWEAFRVYTMGLSHYLVWVDLQREVDADHAEKSYRQALLLEPNNPAVQYNLALLKYFQYRQADNEQAIMLFRNALNAPQNRLQAFAHSGLANSLLAQFNRFDVRDTQLLMDAVYHGRVAIAMDPKLDSAHKSYAYACHQFSESHPGATRAERALNRNLAILHYRKACELNPRHFIAHNNLGNLYLGWAQLTDNTTVRRKLLKQAIRECQAALKILPSYVFAHDNLANAHLGLGQFTKAAESYRDALQYKPDYPEAKNDYAMLHLEPGYEQHDLERAFLLHREALRDVPESEAQRRKLCRQFTERLQANASVRCQPIVSVPKALRESLAGLGCRCVIHNAVKVETQVGV